MAGILKIEKQPKPDYLKITQKCPSNCKNILKKIFDFVFLIFLSNIKTFKGTFAKMCVGHQYGYFFTFFTFIFTNLICKNISSCSSKICWIYYCNELKTIKILLLKLSKICKESWKCDFYYIKKIWLLLLMFVLQIWMFWQIKKKCNHLPRIWQGL